MAGGSGKAGRSGRWRSGVIFASPVCFCEEPYRADELLDLRGERLGADGSRRAARSGSAVSERVMRERE